MRKFPIPHDIIEFFQNSDAGIFPKIELLYRDNLSVSEIASRTGFKKTAIWTAIKKHEADTAAPKAMPYARWRKGHKRTGARPPYGFCLLQGELVRDPREYPTLLFIHKLWKNERDVMSILAELHGRKLKSRSGKKWSYGVVRMVIRRFDSRDIVSNGRNLDLSEDFLKGTNSSKPKEKERV